MQPEEIEKRLFALEKKISELESIQIGSKLDTLGMDIYRIKKKLEVANGD